MRIKIECKSYRGGFSLLELVVVISVMAILVMTAVPALMEIVPRYQMRSGASIMGTIFQQARQRAANTQKPIRVVLDCRKAGGCISTTYQAEFKFEPGKDTTGIFRGWAKVYETNRDIGHMVKVAPAKYQSGGEGAFLEPTKVAGNPADLYWVVFLPNGQTTGSISPFGLTFSSPKLKDKKAGINVSVSKQTGRVTMVKTKI